MDIYHPKSTLYEESYIMLNLVTICLHPKLNTVDVLYVARVDNIEE